MKILNSSSTIDKLSYIALTKEDIFKQNGMLQPYTGIFIKNGTLTQVYSLTEKLLLKLGLTEVVPYGIFADLKTISTAQLESLGFHPLTNRKYARFNNNYSRMKELGADMSSQTPFKFGEKSATNSILEGKNYTFGIEIETSSGIIPKQESQFLNMKSEYDGSIMGDNGEKAFGGEYVTGILKGDSGFMHLNKILSTLNKYCEINRTCSFHIHLGNIDFNKENIVFMWMVLKTLEKELFSIVPKSRRTNAYCGKMNNSGKYINVDEHDYYNSIEKSYSNIVNIVSLGKANGQTINKDVCHPSGRNCGYDKSTPRYWWINFVPTLFSLSGIKGHTIEMRLHSASMNYIKIKNFILLFAGILSFVENHKRDIMKNNYDLSSILKTVYKNKGTYLANYYKERKKLFTVASSEKKEYTDRELVPLKYKNIL